MEEKAMEKSFVARFSVKKATLIFIGIAFIMGILNFYAYLSGTWVPMETVEEGQRLYADLSPSMRNIFIVRMVMVAICFYIVWRNSKNYNFGLSFPDNKWAFAGTIVLMVATILFSVLKIAWVQSFVNIGLMMLLFVISDAIFIAFGVFMMRMAGASKLFQILIPFLGNLLVSLITFGGLFAMGNTYTDPMALVKVIIFFVILSLFYVAFYVLTHRLSVAIIFAALWGIGVAAHAYELPSTFFTQLVAIAASGVCIAGAIASVVLIFVLKKKPSDGLWEYVPAEEGFGSAGANIQADLHSSKSLIVALLSFASVGVTFLTVLLENIEEVTLNLLDIFHNLINWNYRTFADPFEDLIAPFVPLLPVFLAILPILCTAIAFTNFFMSKTTKHIDKLKKGWRWMMIGMGAYIALDIAAIVLLLVQTINGVFKMVPSIVYESNYILNYFANYIFNDAMTYVAVAIAAVLLLVHVGMFLAIMSLYKTGGNNKTRGFQFYLLFVATIVVAIPHIALAFWFQGFVTPIITICDGLSVLLMATVLLNTYKKK